jgi:hypothetical protein
MVNLLGPRSHEATRRHLLHQIVRQHSHAFPDPLEPAAP